MMNLILWIICSLALGSLLAAACYVVIIASVTRDAWEERDV